MADEQAPKKSKLKLIIILVILLLVLAAGGVGAFMLLGGEDAPAEGQQQQQQVADVGIPKDLTSVGVPTFLVNLADPMGRRFIKLTLEFEVANPKIAEEVNLQMPRVRDAVNLLLSSKTYSDLASYENKILLKNEIMERANQALGGVKVLRVNFLELVIQ